MEHALFWESLVIFSAVDGGCLHAGVSLLPYTQTAPPDLTGTQDNESIKKGGLSLPFFVNAAVSEVVTQASLHIAFRAKPAVQPIKTAVVTFIEQVVGCQFDAGPIQGTVETSKVVANTHINQRS